jgi:tRNA pseudouridine13 synthase
VRVPAIERELGIEIFWSKSRGVGGTIKTVSDDFVVEEMLVDGSRADLEPTKPSEITGEGRYLICQLIKRDRDTLLSVRGIAKQLGISERRVRIAGIKDKKALTAQHISIENMRPEKLTRIRMMGIQVHPLRYSVNMVFPHMSYGNRFHITIRDLSHRRPTLQERASNVLNELRMLGGIPNFFGHQRFGTVRPITHLVGKAIAQNDLEKAALIFLAKASLHEHPESYEARQRLWKTRDYREALAYFPKRLLYERMMLARLAKNPRDYKGAFRRLPLRLRNLLLQAYQSYLFNNFLSQRVLRRIPLDEPQPGDYVIKIDNHGLPTNSYEIAKAENIRSLSSAVEKTKMSIGIPLVGSKQSPSGGIQGEIERSILEREEVSQSNFSVEDMPELRAAGRVRPAVTPIIDPEVSSAEKDEINVHKKKLRVAFTLHRGCYATVVLREFMKSRNPIKAGF